MTIFMSKIGYFSNGFSIGQSSNLGPTQPTSFQWKSGLFIGKSYPVGVVVQVRVVDLTLTQGNNREKKFDHG